jgi:predicted nucleic acid-binding protein
MTMPVEPGVVDANILVYAVNSVAPQHAASRALLEAALDPAVSLYVTSQILCEFYSLITNPKRTPRAWSSGDAVQLISELLTPPGLKVLPAPAQAVTRLLELLKRNAVTGSDVFDLQIVATMKANNIQRIYTFNAVDFQKFPELVVVTPDFL